ncbi:hypothetical protein THRCLA_20367 [Thraustotheca clavata]|uniref:Uncharacterized protein n=1 Tax=Thraustotheca clavata TaxID=74557 RepID=A0A1W0A825_9STRA|nr:hypothetical protein THRCLA_20367 [Thraustotheca clavata]
MDQCGSLESSSKRIDVNENSRAGRLGSGRRQSKFEGRRNSNVDDSILGGYQGSRRSSRIDINSSFRSPRKDNNEVETNDPETVALRYQKAELRLLHEEYGKLQEDQIRIHAKRDAAMADLERVQAEFNGATKHLQQMQTLLDKNKALQATQEAKHRMLESDLTVVCANIEEAKKNEKQLLHTTKTNEHRLNKTLEELESLKKELAEEKSNRSGMAVPHEEYERAVNELQHYEKQKAELLAAFKKQIQLIDILKRQKIHLETATLLSFIENEFGKTLMQ